MEAGAERIVTRAEETKKSAGGLGGLAALAP
jgi:hypothetical protein